MHWLIKDLILDKVKLKQSADFMREEQFRRGLNSNDEKVLKDLQSKIGDIETAVNILEKDRRFNGAT